MVYNISSVLYFLLCFAMELSRSLVTLIFLVFIRASSPFFFHHNVLQVSEMCGFPRQVASLERYNLDIFTGEIETQWMFFLCLLRNMWRCSQPHCKDQRQSPGHCLNDITAVTHSQHSCCHTIAFWFSIWLQSKRLEVFILPYAFWERSQPM